jgi:hypothetical protein
MKQLLYAICAGAALSLTIHAQTAKVIALSPEDAAQAKSLYEQKAALEKKIADFQAKIDDKYTMVYHDYPTSACIQLCPNGVCPKTPCTDFPKVSEEDKKRAHVREHEFGWVGGFEFSDDYKFIVPKPYTPPKTLFNYSCVNPVVGNVAY